MKSTVVLFVPFNTSKALKVWKAQQVYLFFFLFVFFLFYFTLISLIFTTPLLVIGMQEANSFIFLFFLLIFLVILENCICVSISLNTILTQYIKYRLFIVKSNIIIQYQIIYLLHAYQCLIDVKLVFNVVLYQIFYIKNQYQIFYYLESE